MISNLRQNAKPWLRLLLVLQVVMLLGHMGTGGASQRHVETSRLAALTQILGYDVAICHHGGGGSDMPIPGSAGDCCAGGFCHCLSHIFTPPSPLTGAAPPIAIYVGSVALPAFIAFVVHLPLGSTSARGPPSSV